MGETVGKVHSFIEEIPINTLIRYLTRKDPWQAVPALIERVFYPGRHGDPRYVCYIYIVSLQFFHKKKHLGFKSLMDMLNCLASMTLILSSVWTWWEGKFWSLSSSVQVEGVRSYWDVSAKVSISPELGQSHVHCGTPTLEWRLEERAGSFAEAEAAGLGPAFAGRLAAMS